MLRDNPEIAPRNSDVQAFIDLLQSDSQPLERLDDVDLRLGDTLGGSEEPGEG